MFLQNYLSSPVSSIWLRRLRLVFGILLCIDLYRYYSNAWLYEIYLSREFFFYYPLFQWIPQFSTDTLLILFYPIQLLLVLGFIYGQKLCQVLLLFLYSYFFLLVPEYYLNHHYLNILLLFVFTITPVKSKTIPYFYVFLFQALLSIVYFYAGIAKINSDWLSGNAVNMGNESIHWIASWMGMFFDLGIPFLFWYRVKIALVVSFFFHAINYFSFPIGLFPLIAFSMSFIFLQKAPKEQTKPIVWQKAFAWIFLSIHLLIPFRHYLMPGDANWNEKGHRFSWRMLLRVKQYRFVPGKMIFQDGRVVVDRMEPLTGIQKIMVNYDPYYFLQYLKQLKERHPDLQSYVYKNQVSLNKRMFQDFILEANHLKSEYSFWSQDSWYTLQ